METGSSLEDGVQPMELGPSLWDGTGPASGTLGGMQRGRSISKHTILESGHSFTNFFCTEGCSSCGRRGWHMRATCLQQHPPGLHPAPANLLPFSKTSLQGLMKWRQPAGTTRSPGMLRA